MCQLTFLRGDPDVVRALLFNVSVINASGNTDGFGYYSFNTKKVFKTKESGKTFPYTNKFTELINRDIPANKNGKASILSHVRATSFWKGKDQKVCDANSHPFQIKDLILAHNGTLYPKDDKDELKNRIDSYWFLKKLSDVVGKDTLLTDKHIKLAMDDFAGKFALLIVDLKQPNNLWIVRGRTADLHYSRFVNDDGEEVLFMINTDSSTFSNTIAPDFLRIIIGKNISREKGVVKEFQKESIYRYNIQSGKLYKMKTEIKEETHVVKSTYTRTVSRHNSYGGWVPENDVDGDEIYLNWTNLFGTVLRKCSDGLLTYSEICILYTLYIGKSIFTPVKIDMENFDKLLVHLNREIHKGRKKVWLEITDILLANNLDVIDIYKLYPKSLDFPWMLNSKKDLTHVKRRVIKDIAELTENKASEKEIEAIQ